MKLVLLAVAVLFSWAPPVAAQEGNYIANLDPATGAQKRYEIEPGTNPHTLVVDAQGIVWYAGNRNRRIGRLDPSTGQIKTIMTGEARDPHTMVFDGKGPWR